MNAKGLARGSTSAGDSKKPNQAAPPKREGLATITKLQTVKESFRDEMTKRIIEQERNIKDMRLDEEIVSMKTTTYTSYIAIATPTSLYTLDLDKSLLVNLAIGDGADVTAIAVSFDLELIVIGRADGKIQVFGIKEKKIIYTFDKSVGEPITAMAMTHSKKFLVVGTINGNISVWDLDSRLRLQEASKSHSMRITSIAIVTDGTVFITVSEDHDMIFWALEDCDQLQVIKEAHEGTIDCMEMTSDDSFIVTGGKDKAICFWNVQRKELEYMIHNAHEDRITSLSISSKNKFMVSGSDDMSFQVWDLEERELIHSYKKSHTTPVVACVLTRDHKILSGSKDRKLSVVNLRGKDPCIITIPKAHSGRITALKALGNEILISAGSDMKLNVWDIEKNKFLYSFTVDDDNEIFRLQITSDNQTLIAGTSKNLHFFDLDRKVHIHTTPIFDFEDQLFSFCLARDDKYLYAGTKKSIYIWTMETKEIDLVIPKAHSLPIRAILSTLDSKFLITGSDDKTIKIWDIQKRELIHIFDKAHEDIIKQLFCTNDSKFIVSTGEDNSIAVWDIERREYISRLDDQHGGDQVATVSSDDRFFISGSRSGTIKFTDFVRRVPLFILPTEGLTAVTAITSANEGKIVISAHEDLKIRIHTNPYAVDDATVAISSSISPYATYGSFIMNQFLNKVTIVEQMHIIEKYPNLYIYPYGWTLFHAVCLVNPARELIRACIRMKIPFQPDRFGKTPIHYLFMAEIIQYGIINLIFENMHELMPEDSDHRHGLVTCFSDVMPQIFKVDSPQTGHFLNCCFYSPDSFEHAELPRYGSIKGEESYEFMQNKGTIFTKEVSNHLLDTEGTQVLKLFVSRFKNDYDPISDDMQTLAESMDLCQNQEIFKSLILRVYVDYLWRNNRQFHYYTFAAFSLLMISLSFYVYFDDRNEIIENIIAAFSFAFLCYDVLQLAVSKTYRSDSGNYLFSFTYSLIIFWMIITWNNFDDAIVDQVAAVSIFFGYTLWVSYLKCFEITRIFIKALIEILKDLRSFMMVLGFLIAGFTLIYQIFDPEAAFTDNLFATYILLYATFNNSEFGTFQMIYFVILLFLLNLVLLNMVIALMGDSFDKTQDSLHFQEAKAKVSMIREAITMKRTLINARKWFDCRDRPPPPKLNKGYLFYACEGQQDEDEGGGGEWESRINNVRKTFKSDLNPLLKKFDQVLGEFKEYIIKSDVEKNGKMEGLEKKMDALDKKMRNVFENIGAAADRRRQNNLPKVEVKPPKFRSSLFYMEKQ
jgi:WD40 repeat protein